MKCFFEIFFFLKRRQKSLFYFSERKEIRQNDEQGFAAARKVRTSAPSSSDGPDREGGLVASRVRVRRQPETSSHQTPEDQRSKRLVFEI